MSHKITLINVEMPDCKGDELLGLKLVDDPLQPLDINTKEEDIQEIGLMVSRQARKKANLM
eukprot:6923997-Ditylum_brightwellii.AAC.1